jgi:hypothetical protein
MANSKFWRTMVVVTCFGLFYMGSAFRGGSGPSVASPAYAGGAGTWVYSHDKFGVIYTSSADGTKLYVWMSDGNPREPRFLKAVTAEKP